MFEYLYEWVQNLAFYLILSTVFLEALPLNSYKKYIRFFTGMVLVLLLMGPILKIFGMEHSLSEVLDGSAYEEEIRQIERTTEYLQEVEVEKYIEKVEDLTGGSENGVDEDKE